MPGYRSRPFRRSRPPRPGPCCRRRRRRKLSYAGAYEVSLHPAETSHYRDNLISGRPSLWVALRQIAEGSYEVANVTADPYEGESMAEGIGEVVEAVPMPLEVQAKVLAFFEAFHVEQVFHKRKRDRADPEALARQGDRYAQTGGRRMSGGDFFSRWSKRKRAIVRENPPTTVPVGSEAVGGEAVESESAPLAGELSEGETLSREELAKLPSLDSLTAQTDLTQFLRAGVPMVMRKAALRRMWSLDTNIRDYVSEAREYAYDWNVVGGVPGNGPLLPTDDIKAMLRDIFDGTPDEKIEPEQESEEVTLIEAEGAGGGIRTGENRRDGSGQ